MRRGMFSRSSRSVAASARLRGLDAARRFGDDVERGHARHHAQELADIAERVARAPAPPCAAIGGGDVHHRAAMAHAGCGRVPAR